MKKYEVLREIYNPCSGQYYFDHNFPVEVVTDDIENTLRSLVVVDMPEYERYTLSDGTVEFILKFPRLERYTFSKI